MFVCTTGLIFVHFTVHKGCKQACVQTCFYAGWGLAVPLNKKKNIDQVLNHLLDKANCPLSTIHHLCRHPPVEQINQIKPDLNSSVFEVVEL